MGTKTPRIVKRAIIREELVALTGDSLAATILNQFLYWSERTSDSKEFIEEERTRSLSATQEPSHGWIFKSIKELHEETMDSSSDATISRRVDALVQKGWLVRRRNPKHRWDRIWQYRPNLWRIQTDLAELGYTLVGYPLQLDVSSPHTDELNLHSDEALPEIT